MKRTLISYATKPEHAEENARLIGLVFEELKAHAPEGLGYMVFRYGDGRFVHVVEQQNGAPSLLDFDAFRAFQKDAGERFRIRPEVSEITLVGSYGMLRDDAGVSVGQGA